MPRPRLRRRRPDRVERFVRIEDIGLAQREIERQRLAARVDVDLVAARRLPARSARTYCSARPGCGAVVHRKHRHHERRAPGLGGDRLHEFRRAARPRGHHEDSRALPQDADQGLQLVVRRDGRGHRLPAPAAVVGRERRGEAGRAGVHRLPHHRFHRREFVVRRLRAGRSRPRPSPRCGSSNGRRARRRWRCGRTRSSASRYSREGLEIPARAREQRVDVHALHHREVLHHASRAAPPGTARCRSRSCP